MKQQVLSQLAEMQRLLELLPFEKYDIVHLAGGITEITLNYSKEVLLILLNEGFGVEDTLSNPYPTIHLTQEKGDIEFLLEIKNN